MGDTHLDCDSQALTYEQSAMSSMTSTPSKSYSSDSETASIPLLYGMTSTPSTPNPGEDTLISSQPVSPANHIPKPEPVGSPKDLTMIETFGPRHESAFGWYDQNTQSLRTFQASFSLETEDASLTASKFWGTFPHWGLMQDGEFIAQPTLGLRTSGNGGGSWPTPRAGKTTDEEEESWRARYEDGKVATPPLGLAVKMHHIPTPTTADVYTGNMKSSQQSDGSMHSVTLPDYVQRWSTPNTRDYKDTGKNTDYKKIAKKSKLAGQVILQQQNTEASLNPDWSSWLMGLPEGWTRLEPLPEMSYSVWLKMQKDGTWWTQWWGPWWMDCPATTMEKNDRKPRLQMLGNGIVPASAGLAIKDMSTCLDTEEQSRLDP